MKKIDIVKAICLVISENDYKHKIRIKKNGDITWGSRKHPMSIMFHDETKTSFRFKLWIGKLANEVEVKAAEYCCAALNSQFYLIKLVVDSQKQKTGLCATIDCMCYTESEVRKFIPIARDIIIRNAITAINYMNNKVKQFNNM